jgi:hypothetical protein
LNYTFTVLAGDANQDLSVNVLDLNALATNFGATGFMFSRGDFNYDGIVNMMDFVILALNFGKNLSGAPPLSLSVTAITEARFGVIASADRRRDLFSAERIAENVLE